MNNRRILELINAAESALRKTSDRQDLGETARAHIERALIHTREAYVATNEIGKPRSVQRLVGDQTGITRLFDRVSRQRSAGPVAKPIRV